ncbi:MAG: hypothetical protein IKH82_04180 [Clostridiales bacterium]|nr:hypothetical protein [Clostridiales bacterium]
MKKVTVVSLIEAFILSVLFVLSGVFISHLIYGKMLTNEVFSYSGYTSFDHEVTDSDGNIYPPGTEFEVYTISASGGLGIRTTDKTLISHGKINLVETNNSDELADALEKIKNQVKEKRADLDNKFIIIGLIGFIVIGAIYFFVNYKVINSDKSRRILCIVSLVVSIVIALGVIVFFKAVL